MVDEESQSSAQQRHRRSSPCCRELRDPVRFPLHERSSDEEPPSIKLGKLRT